MKKINISKYTDSILKTIDKIGKLSKLYRILIFLGVFAILAGPFVWFIYLPKMEKIENLKNEQQTLDSSLLRANAKKRQLKHLQNEMKRLKQNSKWSRKSFPNKKKYHPCLQTFLDQVTRLVWNFCCFNLALSKKKTFTLKFRYPFKFQENITMLHFSSTRFQGYPELSISTILEWVGLQKTINSKRPVRLLHTGS